METREAIERAHEADAVALHDVQSEKLGVVVVAVLAALLAISSVFGRRAVKDLLLYQERSTDAANIAESNEVKARINETTLLTLRVLATDPDTAASAEGEVAALERDITERFQPEREAAERRQEDADGRQEDAERSYESLELSETMLQVAIVFVTIAVAVHGRRMLLAGGGLGLIGLVLLLDGFLHFLPY
jgi:hypothetical protein